MMNVDVGVIVDVDMIIGVDLAVNMDVDVDIEVNMKVTVNMTRCTLAFREHVNGHPILPNNIYVSLHILFIVKVIQQLKYLPVSSVLGPKYNFL
jgi:hypothetical protein